MAAGVSGLDPAAHLPVGTARRGRVPLRQAALDLLARREHTARELQRKLLHKGYAAEAVEQALAALQAEGLQCDRRYLEAYLRERTRRGYGPLRIRHELEQRGLGAECIAEGMAACEQDWAALAQAQYVRRFGAAVPREHRELMQRKAFLQRRGYGEEHIRRALAAVAEAGAAV